MAVNTDSIEAIRAVNMDRIEATMDSLERTLEFLRTKLSFIERRSMNENMKPHEAVRQVMEILNSFQPEMDCQWPLRQIRDVCLDYLRALSLRFPSMVPEERSMLVRLMMHEACKRHLWACNERDREKFRVTVRLCEAIETGEMSYCRESRIFHEAALSLEKVEQGYESCEAYIWLKANGGIEGQYEAPTILNEMDVSVRAITSRIRDAWIRAQVESPMTPPTVTETPALSQNETQDAQMTPDDWHPLSLRPAQDM